MRTVASAACCMWCLPVCICELDDAVMQVRDDVFVFLAEPDFMLPPRLHAKLTSGHSSSFLQEAQQVWTKRQQRTAVILPAFERLRNVPAAPDADRRCAVHSHGQRGKQECFMRGGFDVPLTKLELIAMVADGRVAPFHEAAVRATSTSCPATLVSNLVTN